MTKRKGLSHEEKRQKILELLYEKKDCFQLKELEKIAPKEKGVISQSVKDVLQSLVDDSMVDTEKIGTSVYFWAFPSKASKTRLVKKSSLEEDLKRNDDKLKQLKNRIDEAKVGKAEGEQRESVLMNLTEQEKQKESLLADIKMYKDNDPEVLERLKAETRVAFDAANRWTDNIFSIKSWCKNKFFIEEEKLNKQFGIPEDLDYI